MENETISKIVKYLLVNTISNRAVWSLARSSFNTETSHKMSVYTDEETEFTIEINLNDDNTLRSGSHLYIRNRKIPGNTKGLYNREFPEVKELERKVFEIYIQPNIIGPSEKEKENIKVYNDILNSLGLDHIRDEKLNQILEKDVELDKKESLFKKIIRRV